MKVGIELEVIGTQASFVRAARDLGMEVIQPGYTHAVHRQWKAVPDGSVHGGFEVVSPILESTSADDMGQVAQICAALNTAGCRVNASTGFHVHVDARGLSAAQFKTLVKVFAKFEPVMDTFMPNSRRNNTYCRTILMALGLVSVPSSEEFPVALQQFFQRVDRCRDLRQLHGTLMNTRFLKLNLEAFWRHGTVEFRQHSGTTDAQKVLNWIEFCTGMVERAMREHTRVTLEGAASLDTLFKAVRRPGLKRYYRTRAELLSGQRAGTTAARANASEGV